MNGNIVHGREYLNPSLSAEPISYYSRVSGIGAALTELGMGGRLHVGVIGMGAGTIAAYARPGDSYRFYEINPDIPKIARRYFHFLELCNSCEVVLGDARLSLERETPQQFDLLAVDAFNSNSVPTHLLTREAFALYWHHLKLGGVLAIHASNKYVDLAPVVALAAQRDGKTARLLLNDQNGAIDRSRWVLVTANPSFFTGLSLGTATQIDVPPNLREWTDDYSNLTRLILR